MRAAAGDKSERRLPKTFTRSGGLKSKTKRRSQFTTESFIGSDGSMAPFSSSFFSVRSYYAGSFSI
jgi:hypothetical protein